jgi:putative copper export protein
MYELLLTLHLLGAVTWVGGSIALSILGARLKGPDRGLVAPHFSWYGGTVLTGAAFVVLLAGIGLIREVDGYEFSDAWVWIGLAGWIASAIIGGGFLGRLGKQAEAETDPAERARITDKLMQIARLDTVIIVLVVIDMAVKPGS